MEASLPEFVSILPPSATAAERAIERLTARIDDIPTPIRDVWNPDTCPAALLPWLAWALGVYVWRTEWSEPVQRSVVRNAIAIKRRQGTAASVRDIVAPFGELAIREWWQLTPPGDPHTFNLVLTATGEEAMSAEAFEEVMSHVDRAKPARSWFTATQGLNAVGGLAIAAVARPAQMLRLVIEAVLPETPPGEGSLDLSMSENSALLGAF